MDRQQAEAQLKAIFGIDRFYDEQWQAIDQLLRGNRILMIQKTGFGKSLCYQFPATQFDGVTIVFSPLIALMRDQVRGLNARGIAAAYVNSEQSAEENRQAIAAAIEGRIKILYIAPERQENHEWIDATRRMKLSMVVVDEAHTISTWGHDFRPAFRRIIDLVKLMPENMPILATTATATRLVQADIEKQIGGNLTTIRGSLVRDNFNLRVIKVKSEEEKMMWLAANINRLPGSGLLYTGTRADAETYARWLQFAGTEATAYHAGFDADTRRNIEQGLMQNRWKCVVSTNALGMGIDKPDIRFIIHTQIPASPIHYYQEIGRAGRDGKPTHIILFYNGTPCGADGVAADCRLPMAFIDSARPTAETYRTIIGMMREAPLTERDIIRSGNLKTAQVRVVKADLIDQKIAREVKYGDRKILEYNYAAPEFDYDRFATLRQERINDLDNMVGYVDTSGPRMQYLCRFLDSDEGAGFNGCDNTGLKKLTVDVTPELTEMVSNFRNNFFPAIEVADTTTKTVTLADGTKHQLAVRSPAPGYIEVMCDGGAVKRYCGTIGYNDFDEATRAPLAALAKTHIAKKSRLTDGCAASDGGAGSITDAISASRKSGGDFPDFLTKLILRAFASLCRPSQFDVVAYVPPTASGNQVRNLAVAVASALGLPVSHSIVTTRTLRRQQSLLNSYSKADNVAGAYAVASADDFAGRRVLLIDDFSDTGLTLKEVGRTLTAAGATYIMPLVIAKTSATGNLQ